MRPAKDDSRSPQSAGVLVYRISAGELQVLLVHAGGPFWRSRDQGAWQLPKGLIGPGETADAAARREFAEETGIELCGELKPLGIVRQKGGKVVEAFAAEQSIDPATVSSNSFTMEWPRGSGRWASFPEVDEARWFGIEEAQAWVLPSQAPFLERLAELVTGETGRS
ncbi:NUDIX domain-containing protein [Tsuneonella deserti]|uniref:NUDIX domain-containing protein n=1 Tax=Tsuneonella deserti TaxID=2035528 RepID=UPI0016672A63|nr:NUDIX domain-containing protein [Tsuneonella deserti]